MSVLNQLAGGKHRFRDSYGRFAADSKSGDNTSLGWNDFMPVADFLDPQLGFTVDDTAVFSASFHIIKVWPLFWDLTSKHCGAVSDVAVILIQKASPSHLLLDTFRSSLVECKLYQGSCSNGGR